MLKKIFTNKKEGVDVYFEMEQNSVIGVSTSEVIDNLELIINWSDHHFYEVDKKANLGKKIIISGISLSFHKAGHFTQEKSPTFESKGDYYRAKHLLVILECCEKKGIEFEDRSDFDFSKRIGRLRKLLIKSEPLGIPKSKIKWALSNFKLF